MFVSVSFLEHCVATNTLSSSKKKYITKRKELKVFGFPRWSWLSLSATHHSPVTSQSLSSLTPSSVYYQCQTTSLLTRLFWLRVNCIALCFSLTQHQCKRTRKAGGINIILYKCLANVTYLLPLVSIAAAAAAGGGSRDIRNSQPSSPSR